jgi:SAM-dependent methyltransferase
MLAQADGSEQGPDWYDQSFDASEHWRSHYSESGYYFLWTVIADRILRAQADAVLDIGCGSGQLASLLRDKGIPRYLGLDFSPKRIAQARKVCPEFEFREVDVFATDILDTYDYDVVLSTEFLEHVERDLDVIAKVRSKKRFIGTVPNFPYVSHVRHFRDANEVSQRYQEYFTDFRVDTFLADPHVRKFFLVEGIKR